MAIVDLRSGKALTAREIKSSVMAARGWTSEQYQKQYDILRNKTRNYEKLTGQPAGSIKVNELLFTQTKAQKRYGAKYRPSKQLEAIQATPSVGTAKFAAQGASAKTILAQEDILKSQFSGLTSKYTEAREIVEKYEAKKTADVELPKIAQEVAKLREERKAARKAGDLAKTAELKKQIDAARRQAKKIEEAAQGAPQNVAELKQQLERSAKSLKAYQEGQRKKWAKSNGDAPASYAVGTP